MFFANLNVFLAASLILSVFAGGLVGVVLMMPMAVLARTFSVNLGSWAWVIGYLAVPLILGVIWVRRGLAPEEIHPDREARYRKGQRLLLVTNVSVGAALLLPMLFAVIGGKPEYSLYGFYLLPLMAVGLIAGPIGLFMVWNSRA